jgi:hypothetical protein
MNPSPRAHLLVFIKKYFVSQGKTARSSFQSAIPRKNTFLSAVSSRHGATSMPLDAVAVILTQCFEPWMVNATGWTAKTVI